MPSIESRLLERTEAGQAFLIHARVAVEESQQAEVAVSRFPVALAQAFIAPKLSRFIASYPDLAIDLQIRGGQNDPIAQQVDVVFQTAYPHEGCAIDSEETLYSVDRIVRESAIPDEFRPVAVTRRFDAAFLSSSKGQL